MPIRCGRQLRIKRRGARYHRRIARAPYTPSETPIRNLRSQHPIGPRKCISPRLGRPQNFHGACTEEWRQDLRWRAFQVVQSFWQIKRKQHVN